MSNYTNNTSFVDLLKTLSPSKKKELKLLYFNLVKKGEIPDNYKIPSGEEQQYINFVKKLCKKKYKYFLMLFSQIIKYGDFEMPLHVDILTEICQQHFNNNLLYNNEVIINIAPGHSKTLTANIGYSAWSLGLMPYSRHLTRTAAESVVKDNHMSVIKIIKSQAFIDLFGDIAWRQTQDEINTTAGGYLKSSPFNANITGANSDFTIVDDPNDITSALSGDNITIDKTNAMYSGGIKTRDRGEKHGRVNFIIMQRLLANDLTGYIVKQSFLDNTKINQFILRAKEDKNTIFTIKCKNRNIYFFRPKGYLWNTPSMIKRYKDKEKIPSEWWPQYQQDPSNSSLVLIKLDYFQYYDDEIYNLPIYETFITTDFAYTTDKASDRTCICCWGLDRDQNLYLLDIFFDKIPVENLKDTFLEFYKKNSVLKFKRRYTTASGKEVWEQQFLYKVYIEETKNESFIPELKRLGVEGINVLQRKANTTKEIRLYEALPFIAQKKVFFPRNRKFREILMIKEELQDITKENINSKTIHDDACFVAGTKIKTLRGDVEIQNIKKGDKIITPFGIREVECCKNTGIKEVIYNKELDLIGTPDHKILDNKKQYDNLIDAKLCNSIKYNLTNLLIWKIKWNIFLIKNIIYGLVERKKKEREYISFVMTMKKEIGKEKTINPYILQYMNMSIIVKCQKVLSYIIKIATHLIITPIIYNYLQIKNIYNYIIKLVHIIHQKLLKQEKKIFLTLLKNLSYTIKAILGEQDKKLYLQQQWLMREKLGNVNYVIENTNIATFHKQKIELYATNAMMLGGIEQKELLKMVKLPVWNLKVKGGCYFANNILVSNCDNILDAVNERAKKATYLSNGYNTGFTFAEI